MKIQIDNEKCIFFFWGSVGESELEATTIRWLYQF